MFAREIRVRRCTMTEFSAENDKIRQCQINYIAADAAGFFDAADIEAKRSRSTVANDGTIISRGCDPDETSPSCNDATFASKTRG